MPATTRRFLDKKEVDRTVLELARERIVQVFDRFDHVCVAFSGGKDSTTVLGVTLDEHRRRYGSPTLKESPLDGTPYDKEWTGKQLDVLFYDEEAIPPDTENYLRHVFSIPDISGRWFCLPYCHLNATSPSTPYWWCFDPDMVEKWCRPLPPEAIVTPTQAKVWEKFTGVKPPNPILEGFPEYPKESRPQLVDCAPMFFRPADKYGSVGYVMGIRADESMTRLRAVTRRMEDNWLVFYTSPWNEGHVTKAYPVYDFRTADVWTFARECSPEIGYNSAYDLQEMHGFHGSQQRIAPPFGAEPMQMLPMYATCWPELWDKMVDRVPGAATAARYARSELYSFRGRPIPRAGETWRDLIERLLDRHHTSTREIIRERLIDEIKWHYSITKNPILPTAPHPATGLSGEWLAMIAMRGDLKKRKVAGWEIRDQKKTEHEYREQYEELKKDGTLKEMTV